MKKKLLLNKRTISKLNINQDNVLVRDEMGVIKTGSNSIILVGTSSHPKYC